ncbi:SRPBCC family protein [Streptomyces laurentii]|uniref:SRPBCC family protein n=1 Tax=Streptomyces laurentii TaxID=39478 RepID=UPI0036884A1E
MTASTSVVVERKVAASPGRVWLMITDLPELPRTLSAVDRVEVLTQGGFAVGTRWRETRRTLGRQATEELTVTVCEPAERYVTVADAGGMHYACELALAPDGPLARATATTLRLTYTARPGYDRAPTPLTRLLGRLGTRVRARSLARDLEEIARAVETRG